jgi:hypothetical protein
MYKITVLHELKPPHSTARILLYNLMLQNMHDIFVDSQLMFITITFTLTVISVHNSVAYTPIAKR